MAGYQRMVSYLYEYNRGEKGTNVGYAKLEIREDTGSARRFAEYTASRDFHPALKI